MVTASPITDGNSKATTVEGGVQRFGLFWSADKERNGVMEEFDHGNWVQASDYDAMLAQLVMANEAIELLRSSQTASEKQAESWKSLANQRLRDFDGYAVLLREAQAGFDVIANKEGHPRWDICKRIDALLGTPK